MSYIRKDDYTAERARPKILAPYVSQMQAFLKNQHPEQSSERIDAFIKKTIQERFTAPTVEGVVHKKEGYSTAVKMPLDVYVREVIGDNNLSPSGSCYLPVSVKESFLRRSIEAKIKARNAFKKLYLAAEARGDQKESQYYNLNQANSKIFNNAIAGGMKITQFILGSKAGFNAITSIGRMGVKQGYSFIERLVNGNIYLPNTSSAIGYIFTHIRNIPEGFSRLITENILYVPTCEEVYSYLEKSMVYYSRKIDKVKLIKIIQGITDVERSYVFYAGCFSNLCHHNDTRMRTWIDSCFIPDEIDPVLYQDIDLAEIKSFRDDVLSCVLSTNYRMLGMHPEKKNQYNTIKDASEHNPQGLRAFIYACKHFTTNFEILLYILKPIFAVETTFAKLTFQDNLARETVPLSDTDSNIFSVQELVRWKCGRIDFGRDAYCMNGLTTFLISQSLEHLFGRFSAGLGAEGKDVFRISMKNEFLYPVLIATSKAKHYIAVATMQEGNLLPKPRRDIKGVGFRSSAYPKVIKDSFEEYVVDFQNEVQKGEPLRAMKILQDIATLEHQIANSIRASESQYLQTVSVRVEEDYKDPSKSQYFYYEVWRDVFAEDYGDMTIPNKCFKIPLRGGEKLFKNKEFMEGFAISHPKIHKRMVDFLAVHPTKKISYLLIPPFKGNLRPLFLDIMDIRAQVSQVMSAYYNFLDGLGIGNVNTKYNTLVSDFCDPTAPMLDL